MNLIFSIIFCIIILIVVIYITPLIQFQSWYDWWNTYDPGNKYKCFSLTMMAYYKYSYIAYESYKLVTPLPNQFTYDWWALFLSSIMAGEAFGIVPNGLCTPKTLCESLIPGDYPINPLPPNNVRAWPTTENEWTNLLMAWLGFTSIPLHEDDWKPDLKKWSDPDNFLNKWGIPADSPAVIAFVTDWPVYKSDKIYPEVLVPLLGLQGGIGGFSAGGWFGYLQAGQDFGGNGLVEANRMIWSSEPLPSINKAQNESKCNAANITSGAIGMGMGGAFAGQAIATAFAFETAGLSVIIGGLVGLLGGGALTAAGSGCI
jgi:hypothetical protein